MLFSKRKRVVKRILIVEDEPLTAFDTETMLASFGYEVVATLDNFEEAVGKFEREEIHLVIADVRLHGENLGVELAKIARERGVPTLLATGHWPPPASAHAIGCLSKPYTERLLKQALESVDRFLQGESVKPLKGLELYVIKAE
ncbi:MAG TPA: response regulator [Sphingomicrobium sp.]|nr:response regulator [Sphingomicrobium sp.]